ncbi:sigma 54-interacting transcriptional regulator [Acinetobacter pollinis]|uniref:sigma 54-interacting transcriptional regulator n=1 Tax=Acinetobacter pollinis TaxID=2605270 RepID=UPI0018C3371B|nr:sigma 54-interacting transcriptional regulator [Acinetobacter pollinis]MBF7694189.1 sigma 54-interacting transcriptional regulator [Acinetobacter pollinis]MBF7701777.1 sigma 54-interacting transcriptional regulator [Acinetobacter pollinis]
MKYFYFLDGENTKNIDLKELKEIKPNVDDNFENYFDIKKNIFFNELQGIYPEDILLKFKNYYETLNAADLKKIKEIKNRLSNSKDKKENAMVEIIDFLIKFKKSKIVFLLNTNKIYNDIFYKFIDIIINHIDSILEQKNEINFCIHPDISLKEHHVSDSSEFSYFIEKIEVFYIEKYLEKENEHENILEDIFHKSGPILIEGETGVGKTKIAEIISNKLEKKLIYKNISAVPEELIGSILRGYTQGSFTGATKNATGIFEDSDNNILFLDEFQNFSMNAQVQLLDLLNPISNKVNISRIGSNDIKSFNVKVILAINENINDLLREKRIRPDVFYRIRNTHRLNSFNERLDILLKNKYDPLAYVKKLLFIYFWKSFSIDNYLIKFNAKKLSDEVTLNVDSFFPFFSEEILIFIKERKWNGNYRELSVKILDIFYLFNKSSFRSFQEIFFKSFDCNINNEYINDNTLKKVHIIQSTMMKNNYNFAKSGAELTHYKLKSYQSLITFIRKHKDKFDNIFIERIERNLNKKERNLT